jgi:nitrogen regulatory protein PII-like uncharacterized protein
MTTKNKNAARNLIASHNWKISRDPQDITYILSAISDELVTIEFPISAYHAIQMTRFMTAATKRFPKLAYTESNNNLDTARVIVSGLTNEEGKKLKAAATEFLNSSVFGNTVEK